MRDNFIRQRFIVYTVFLVASFTANDVFAKNPDKSLAEYANSGYQLLTAKRFSNAEVVLRQAVSHKDMQGLSNKSQLQLLGFLEASLMYQNKYPEMHKLLNKKFAVMDASGMKPSFDYATTMLNSAESLYYMGQKSEAIETTQASITMMRSLPKVNQQVIAFAESNIAQYQANQVEIKPLMKDLSQFFTQCENLTAGTPMSDVRQAFSNNLEVGRDYFPKGILTDVFATAIPAGVDKDALKNVERRVFIPDAAHASDWCIVYKDNNTVKTTIVAPD